VFEENPPFLRHKGEKKGKIERDTLRGKSPKRPLKKGLKERVKRSHKENLGKREPGL